MINNNVSTYLRVKIAKLYLLCFLVGNHSDWTIRWPHTFQKHKSEFFNCIANFQQICHLLLLWPTEPLFLTLLSSAAFAMLPLEARILSPGRTWAPLTCLLAREVWSSPSLVVRLHCVLLTFVLFTWFFIPCSAFTPLCSSKHLPGYEAAYGNYVYPCNLFGGICDLTCFPLFI